MKRRSLALLLTLLPSLGFADEMDQAIRMHNRLTGAPPAPALLQQMASLIAEDRAIEAALLATENEGFLKVTIKNLVAPWTNEDASSMVPLNDYTATLIGIARDDLPIHSVFDNISYVGADALGLPPYANGNNNHYEAFESGQFQYSDPNQFVQRPQTALTGFEIGAGVLTSRGFSAAFYDDGTNRLPFAHVMETYLCREMEQLHDNTLPKAWVRQDVERDPGGDVALYLAKCSGCHGLMDGLSPAFAHNDFVDGVNIYDTSVIPAKMTRNADVFPAGRRITSDRWVNFMTQGPNQAIGWNNAPATGLYEGKGLVAFSQMVLETDALAPCMAKHAYKKVCLRRGEADAEKAQIAQLANNFADNDYKIRHLFAEAATLCAGE
jgi:hypothetical protein